MYYSYPFSPAMTSPALSFNNRPSIEVTGEATTTATPNRSMIILGVITESSSLSTAQSENASAVNHVISALLGLQIPRKQIQTAAYSINMHYDYEDGNPIFRGYRVTHLLQITLDNVDQTGLVVDTAVNSGANTVSSVRFTIANFDLHYNQALSLAIQNAASKADTVARTVGAALVRTPVKITEESHGIEQPVPMQALFLAEGSASSTPIQPGQLQIRAEVRVQYIYS